MLQVVPVKCGPMQHLDLCQSACQTPSFEFCIKCEVRLATSGYPCQVASMVATVLKDRVGKRAGLHRWHQGRSAERAPMPAFGHSIKKRMPQRCLMLLIRSSCSYR